MRSVSPLLLQDHLFAFFQAAQNFGYRTIGQAHFNRHFALAFLVAPVRDLDGGVLLWVVHHGVFRNRQYAFMFIKENLGVGGHVGLQLAARVVNGDAYFKRGDVVFLHAQGRDLGYTAVEDTIAEAFHLDTRRLIHVHVGDVGLVHLTLHVDLAGVALCEDQGRRGAKDQDGADGVAD